MRTFVAIDVPGSTAAVEGPAGHAPEHLTLRFLGEVEERAVPAISNALAEAAGRVAPFELTVAGVGGFPDRARPRIVFAEVTIGRAEVVRLAAEVESALGSLGIPPEGRPFVPHVTLLRVRTPRDRERARRLVDELGDRRIASTTVRELLLKASDLRPEGAVHRVIGRYGLGGAPPPA